MRVKIRSMEKEQSREQESGDSLREDGQMTENPKREQGVREKSAEMRHDKVRKRDSDAGVCFDCWLCPKYLSVNVGADGPKGSALNQAAWLLTLSEDQIPFTLTSSHPA